MTQGQFPRFQATLVDEIWFVFDSIALAAIEPCRTQQEATEVAECLNALEETTTNLQAIHSYLYATEVNKNG